MERELIRTFEQLLDEALPGLTAVNRDEITARAGEFLEIRGFGPVKEAAVENMRATRA
jgi:indolepyruvate ferredoxin oxidoreductase